MEDKKNKKCRCRERERHREKEWHRERCRERERHREKEWHRERCRVRKRVRRFTKKKKIMYKIKIQKIEKIKYGWKEYILRRPQKKLFLERERKYKLAWIISNTFYVGSIHSAMF